MTKSISDLVAAQMNAVLESDEHKSLFNTNYKTASLKKVAETYWCPKCNTVKEPDMTGACPTCNTKLPAEDQHKADDSSVHDSSSAADCSMADDSSSSEEDSKVSSAYSLAIDSLLTASAALDSVGFEKSAALSLQMAAFVVEAAKKKGKEKKDSKPVKKDSKPVKKDSKPVKKDSKPVKKDEKKSDKKDSKK